MGVIFVLGTRPSFAFDGEVQRKDTTIAEQIFYKFYTAVGNLDHTPLTCWSALFCVRLLIMGFLNRRKAMYNGGLSRMLD